MRRSQLIWRIAALLWVGACSDEPTDARFDASFDDRGDSGVIADDASPPDAGETAFDGGETAFDGGDATLDGSTADGGTDAGSLPLGQVRIESGIVEGVAEGDVYAFKGIPYAAAPTGSGRFRPPTAVPPWSGVRAAADFGPVCPQRNRRGVIEGDEDCLHLNVWGHLEADAPKPVMVWIHGGGFVQGSNSVSIYDGAQLASQGDVVVVTINYRIGALGFLALPELIAEDARNTAGNYGILDQIAALAWVRDNIAGFGGAPDNVTIFGESAGGSSVCVQLAAPAAQGLFHRAAIQSGGGCYGLPNLIDDSGGSAVDVGREYVVAAGCDEAADVLRCLRSLSVEALTSALFNIPASGLGLPDVGPVVDGVVLPEQAFDIFARGAGPRVPMVVGSNLDETVSFNAAVPVPGRSTFEFLVGRLVGADRRAEVVALYPESTYPVAKDAYNAFSSDIAFNCTAEAFARTARTQNDDVYLYHFEQQLQGPLGAQGVLHGQEIAFVFGTLSVLNSYVPTAADAALSAEMLQAWATFAATGRPSLAGPPWLAYRPGMSTIMNLGTPRVLDSTYREARCEVLRRLNLIP